MCERRAWLIRIPFQEASPEEEAPRSSLTTHVHGSSAALGGGAVPGRVLESSTPEEDRKKGVDFCFFPVLGVRHRKYAGVAANHGRPIVANGPEVEHHLPSGPDHT